MEEEINEEQLDEIMQEEKPKKAKGTIKKKGKKDKKEMLTEFEQDLEERKAEDPELQYPVKTLINGVNYVREDQAIKYVNSLPEEVTERFLIRKPVKRIWNPFSWFAKEEEYKPRGNMLWLMDNEGNVRVWDKIQSGVFKINEYHKGSKEKDPQHLILKPGKLRTITYENEHGREEYDKVWIADINQSTALPNEGGYDCETVSDAINQAVTGNRNFNKKDSSFGWGWIKWVFIALVVIYLGYIIVTKNLWGVGDLVGYGKTATVGAGNALTSAGNGSNVAGGTLQG